MWLIFVVLGITAFSNAGEVEMFYDDGTPSWFYEGIGGCGVWFSVEDFLPSGSAVELTSVEMWFLMSPYHPRETSECYMEIWSGIVSSAQLCQISVTAEENAAFTVDVSSENITVDSDFWILKNTELSAGGWPDAWVTSGDLCVRCYGEVSNSIDSISWASLKTVF